MKKILISTIILIFVCLFFFFNIGIKALYADEVEINFVNSISGSGSPGYLNGAIDVYISGDYAYIVSYFDNAFTIFNISDPENPVHITEFHSIGSPYKLFGPYSIVVEGDYAYIASHANNALTIFNVSDPANAYHAGEIEGLPWKGGQYYLYGASDVFVEGDYAYIASRHDDALTIFDISDPTDPTHVGLIEGAGAPNYLDGASTVYVQGDYAYVTATLDSSLSIFNISDPSDPTLAGSIQGSGTANFLDSQMDAWVVGDYAYAVCLEDDTFSVIDISDPADPTVVGSITHNDYYVWLGGAYSVFVQGSYAYIGGRTKDSLVIINISDPTNPVHKKSVRSIGSPYYISGASGIYVVGNYVYLTGPGDDSLSIFDINIISDADISVSPGYEYFENVDVGSSGSKVFTITNEGAGDLSIGTISISGTDAGQFSITEDNASGQIITSGNFQTITITFEPDSAGSKLALLSIPSNDIDEDPLEISLTGGNSVGDFVASFYLQCLGREPDPGGLDYWANALILGDKTGEDIGYGFVMGAEYLAQNTSDTDFVTMGYNVFLGRAPDAGGLGFWVEQLSRATRPGVLNGLIHSAEFESICSSSGITAYTPGLPGFVNRFYALTLERLPDAGGLAYWVSQLESGVQTGEDIANGFIFSEEFLAQNHSNGTFVSILYNAFFDRVPDSGGYAYWVSLLDGGMTREEVLNEFIYSTEFEGICTNYGILPYPGYSALSALSQEVSIANIISLSLDTAQIGDSLAIEGTGFGDTQGTSYVTFHNGIQAVEYLSWSDTLIELTVPEGAQTGDIYITTGAVISNFTYLTIEEASTIPSAADPYISPMNPTESDDLAANYIYSDPNGDPESGSEIRWYKDGDLQPDYDDQLTVPSSATSIGEVWHFTVTPSDGTGFGEMVVSDSVDIVVLPAITSVNPTAASIGDSLVIEGTGFGDTQDTSFVTFHNDIQAVEYLSWSDTQIEITVPEGAQTGDIYITTGAVISNFIYLTIEEANSLPSATEPYISPTNPADPDDLVANYIYSDLDGDPESGSEIKWYRDDILIPDHDDQLTVPSSATSPGELWYFTVTPSDGTGFGEMATSDSATITVLTLPAISSLIPDTASIGDIITITGIGFGDLQGTGYVTFHDGIQAIEYISWSDTQIEVTVPEDAQTGDITITTDEGTSSPLSLIVE